MINHIMIGSSDIERSRAFYSAVLGVLGAGKPFDHVNATGQKRIFFMHDGSTFCLTEPIDGCAPTTANGSTIGFTCHSPEQIQQFHDVAIASGGTTTEEPPGPRESDLGDVYLCYFLDPDGHKICGFYRPS
ncbi:MAG: VOC family protein [Halioglobus sp.]|nr:VOC family protein [Halioglobus sp.]